MGSRDNARQCALATPPAKSHRPVSVGHYENFPVASLLVPAHLRGAVVALYRFARTADDIADEGDATGAERIAALSRFDDQLSAIAAGAVPSEPPFADIAAAIRRHGLPIAPLHDLVAAFRQDVTTTRYATQADLDDYCAHSANPVGRTLLALYGAGTPANVAASDAICTALQLTNFWQDVKGDWGRGRIYLPGEEMQAHGVDETALVGENLTPAWREAIASAVSRTRALFDDGKPLCDRLHGRLRYEIRMTWLGGTRILDRIEAANYDVLNHRPTLGATDLPWLVAAALGWPKSIPSHAATT